MMAEQERTRPIRLTPEQVAKLDPFGVRRPLALEELAELLGNEEERELALFPEWTRGLISREKQSLEQFFGFIKIDIPSLPEEVTEEKILHWQELEMELHYLPPITMGEDLDFPGWQVKPASTLYASIMEGNASTDSLKLPGKWVLVDTRVCSYSPLPNKISYPNDFLGPTIEALRRLGKLSEDPFVSLQSRASITPIAYRYILKPEIARILKVAPEQVRLPRTMEINFLANTSCPQLQKSHQLEWLEDEYKYKNKQKFSTYGGCEIFRATENRQPGSSLIGFRPLVEF